MYNGTKIVGGNKMPRNIDIVIKEFILKLSELLGERMKKAILYGSYARGDYYANSDIDIMILTDLNDSELIEYRKKVRELACDIEMDNEGVVISPLLRNIDKYNERISIVPFYHNVQNEGVVIHG